jgi:hypothetical protein
MAQYEGAHNISYKRLINLVSDIINFIYSLLHGEK